MSDSNFQCCKYIDPSAWLIVKRKDCHQVGCTQTIVTVTQVHIVVLCCVLLYFQYHHPFVMMRTEDALWSCGVLVWVPFLKIIIQVYQRWLVRNNPINSRVGTVWREKLWFWRKSYVTVSFNICNSNFVSLFNNHHWIMS